MAAANRGALPVTRALESVARLVAVAFWYLTALFAWLISIPFAYQNFIKPRLLPDFTRRPDVTVRASS